MSTMAAEVFNVPEDVDLFRIPHLRMKQLVTSYLHKLQKTDFSNNRAMESLLCLLNDTFCEFKCHEDIENMLILERLQDRMHSLSVDDSSVCNCHANSKLSEVLEFVKNGYAVKSKSVKECIDYGNRLRKVLNDFTDTFLPHMKEEEEVYQPLLLKYFDYNELKLLKDLVLSQHFEGKNILVEDIIISKLSMEELPNYNVEQLECSDTVCGDAFSCTEDINNYDQEIILAIGDNERSTITTEECKSGESSEKNVPKENDEKIAITSLPETILLEIFSYLNIPERLKCSQVCKLFNNLVCDESMWRSLLPTQWALGYWSLKEELVEDLIENQDHVWTMYFPQDVLNDENDLDDDSLSWHVIHELKILNGLVEHVLPRFGHCVRKFVAGGSTCLSNKMLRNILKKCPNLQYLNVSHTRINIHAFKDLATHRACANLQHVDVSGCIFIGDAVVFHLTACWSSVPNAGNNTSTSETSDSSDDEQEVGDNGWEQVQEVKDSSPRMGKSSTRNNKRDVSGVKYLNFSGCSALTNHSLDLLSKTEKVTSHVEELDLSGCFLMTGGALKELVAKCTKLKPEKLWYCNSITDGPHAKDANGCDNIHSGKRACCIVSSV